MQPLLLLSFCPQHAIGSAAPLHSGGIVASPGAAATAPAKDQPLIADSSSEGLGLTAGNASRELAAYSAIA